MQRFGFAAVAASLTIALVAACSSDSPTTPDSNGGQPPAAAVSSVELSPSTSDVMVGATTTLAATLRDASGKLCPDEPSHGRPQTRRWQVSTWPVS
jgi:uncharacterized lipoprotein